VGAPRINHRLHIFERSAGAWSQVLTTPPNAYDHDWLGRSAAIDQGWVAATFADSIGVPPIGIWNKSNGNWALVSQLLFGAQMVPGESVDISLPRVAAGDSDWGGDRGRVAVYLLPNFGGAQSPEDELTPGSVIAGDLFGWSLALAGDRLVVGSPGFDSMGVSSSGAAGLYERSGTSWTLVRRQESLQPGGGGPQSGPLGRDAGRAHPRRRLRRRGGVREARRRLAGDGARVPAQPGELALRRQRGLRRRAR
jgi:hypothetical protein